MAKEYIACLFDAQLDFRLSVVIRKFVSRQLSGNSFLPFHPPWRIRLSRYLFPPNSTLCHHLAGGSNHERTQRRVCRIGDQKGNFGETEGRADQKKCESS